ncbi:transport energizing protein, ExbD/TolR family [Selenomonas sp. oral taxon 892 str. F0426]|jgi:putative biopolymer transport exbD protein|nr:transport energizing protein, ExbD/TolR family [Selenomonas sp. oral taxon 892 str. F0426]
MLGVSAVKLDLLPPEERPQLMIIPMIDIIFFLLVFFMMSMLSMVVQKSMPLTLPQAESAKVSMTRNIPVTITADGGIYYERDLMSLRDLTARLTEDVAHGEDISVILRGDAAASYGTVVQVMDVVKRLGIEKVYIATDTPG